MLKADVLREKKRLKAVRRKKREIKNHNYITKTLEKPEPIWENMAETVKEAIRKIMNFNKGKIKSRYQKGGNLNE